MQIEGDRKPPGFIDKYCAAFVDHYGLRHKRLLDVGCGPGDYVTAFHRCSVIAHGVDKFARDNANYADVEKELPFPDKTFDCIHSKSLVEHVINIENTIFEMHRVLKPGGICLMLTPDLLAAKWSFWGDIRHVTPFNKAKLAQLLSFAEFHSITCERFTKWPHGWRRPLRGMLIASGVK